MHACPSMQWREMPVLQACFARCDKSQHHFTGNSGTCNHLQLKQTTPTVLQASTSVVLWSKVCSVAPACELVS
eukprot:4982116-Amphidinium_carterae.3